MKPRTESPKPKNKEQNRNAVPAPFDPEEFRNAAQYAVNVSSGALPDAIPSPSESGFAVQHPDGRLEYYQFSDTPYMRFQFAIARWFQEKPVQYLDFTIRFQALSRILLNLPGHYVRAKDANHAWIHEAVYRVAATQPFVNAGFDLDAFVAELRRIAPPGTVEPPDAKNLGKTTR